MINKYFIKENNFKDLTDGRTHSCETRIDLKGMQKGFIVIKKF